MEYNEFKEYFLGLASSHVDILHHETNNDRFCTDFNNDVQNKWQQMDGVFVVLNDGVGGFEKMDLDFLDKRRSSIEINVCCGDWMSDPKSKQEARNKAESIAKDFVSKMILDSENYESCPRFLSKFDARKAIYQNFESTMSNFMTCVLSFEIIDENYLEYNPEKWH